MSAAKQPPLDTILKAWHDTSVPTKAIKFLNAKFPLNGPQNQAVENATVNLCAAMAYYVDAHRTHPELSYSGALSGIAGLYNALPKPEKTALVPEGLALTPDERVALTEGKGDRPLGAA